MRKRSKTAIKCISIAVLVLALGLSGCGKKTSSDAEGAGENVTGTEAIDESGSAETEQAQESSSEADSGQVQESVSETEAEEAQESASENSVADASEEAESVAQTTEVIETEVPEDGDFTVGIIANGAYRNSFLWLRFVPEEGWTLNDQAVMTELNSGISTEGISTVAQYAARVRDELNAGGIYYDLCAEEEKDFMNAVVAIQKIPLVSGQKVDHADVLQQSREILDASLRAQGAEAVDTVITTCGFLRSHQSGLWFHVRTPATDYAPPQDLYGRQVHRIHGPYDAVITVTSIGKDRTQELLDRFHGVTE